MLRRTMKVKSSELELTSTNMLEQVVPAHRGEGGEGGEGVRPVAEM